MAYYARRRAALKRKRATFVNINPYYRPRKRRRIGGYGRKPALNVRTGGYQGMELKFYDQTNVADNVVTTANGSGMEVDPSATVLLNTVTQGNGESQRLGRKMTMKSIYVCGVINIAAVADQTVPEDVPHIAIWLVLDKQTNGATLNSEDVFSNLSGDLRGGTSLLRNLQFSTRFTVLAKASFTMPVSSISGDSTNFDSPGISRQFKLFANLKNMNVLFSGTTETVANIIDNSLHMVASCTSTTMGPTITYNSRLRFTG